MAKKRVHEIAKAQGVSSKELLAALKAAGVDAKAAASSVEEADALRAIGASNGGGGAATQAPPKPKEAQATPKPAPATPKAAAPAEGPDYSSLRTLRLGASALTRSPIQTPAAPARGWHARRPRPADRSGLIAMIGPATACATFWATPGSRQCGASSSSASRSPR